MAGRGRPCLDAGRKYSRVGCPRKRCACSCNTTVVIGVVPPACLDVSTRAVLHVATRVDLRVYELWNTAFKRNA